MRPASARLPSTNKPVGRGSAPRFSSYVAPSSPSSPSVGPIAPPQPVTLLGRAAAAVCNALVALSLTLGAPSPAAADGSALYDYLARKKERLVLEGRQSNLNEELFTAESWEGMTSIVNYARYVNSICEDLEKQPGCEECEDNRVILEHAWQVVANEFYDSSGTFTQAGWADQLSRTLRAEGGTLRSKQQLYAAAQGMIGQLHDKYSAFLPPGEFRAALRRPLPRERSYLAAQYVGPGVQLEPAAVGGGWVVEAALAGSPAEEAGIVRGDRLVSIDGIAVDSKLSLTALTGLLRGPTGSPVTLEIQKRDQPAGAGVGLGPTSAAAAWPAQPPASLQARLLQPAGTDAAAPQLVTLERRALPQPAVKSAELALPDGRPVMYARLFWIGSDASRELQSLVSAGEAVHAAGYIIDLRNNPGGVFEEAVAMASYFLEDGDVIARTVRNEEVVDETWQVGALSAEIFPSLPGRLTRKPLVLLVNGGTASASEVLAGALRDNGKRALLLGEQTFGKGVVQYYFPMPEDDSGLKLTVAKYLTPANYDITRQGGVKPDLQCSDYPRGLPSQGPEAPPLDQCIADALRQISRQRAAAGGAALRAPPPAPSEPPF